MIGSTFTIVLTRDQQAFVDEREWYSLRKHKWGATWDPGTHSFYAVRSLRRAADGKRPSERMHRRIMALQPGDGQQVDHINHNTLDNRRQNLQVVDPRGNQENSRRQSAFGPGIWKVTLWRTPRPFAARTKMGGRKIHIGYFATPEQAQEARRRFIRKRNRLDLK